MSSHTCRSICIIIRNWFYYLYCAFTSHLAVSKKLRQFSWIDLILLFASKLIFHLNSRLFSWVEYFVIWGLAWCHNSKSHHQYLVWATVRVLAAPFLNQISANCLGKQRKMPQELEYLLPTWDLEEALGPSAWPGTAPSGHLKSEPLNGRSDC